MAKADRSRVLATTGQWVGIGVCIALGVCQFLFVELTPKIQADFFFSSEDPQLQSSKRIEREFGAADQIVIAAKAKNLVSREYLRDVYELSRDLRRLKGVADVRSVTHGPKHPGVVMFDEPRDTFDDLEKSPFWSRLLLAPDRSASFIVLALRGRDAEATIHEIDRLLRRHSRTNFELGVSGVHYVASHVRQRLTDDLLRFSTAAFVAFAILVTLLFRSIAIVMGTMAASLTAAFGTFIVRDMLGMEADILMPNLWTIAFVLTLSHVVYLTAEWRRNAGEMGSERATAESIRVIGPACAWSLAANLIGFASLMFVAAKPLRQFGISGAIASVLAAVCAFTLYPPFLRAATPGSGRPNRVVRRMDGFFTRPHRIIAAATVVTACVVAPFAFRVNTDPSLPSYFAEDDPMSVGLRAIDRAGGSSTLDLVVADAKGRALGNDTGYEKLKGLQHRLERHEDVGSVLSIALLMEEARRPWYSFLFSWKSKLKRLESPKHDRVGRAFISDDRREARFLLRMRETSRSRPREEVLREIKGIVRDAGFRPVIIGGLYPLQGQLSKLVEGSVVRGLGSLLAVFVVIVLIVSRSIRTALAMGFCLAITPLALFGLVGVLGMPLDIISAPAANVALPMGIDEMIHMGHTMRSERRRKGVGWPTWRYALERLWAPILASMLIVVSGFLLFLLSSFPPTRRLGILVCLGTVITDLVVLIVLPTIATFLERGEGHTSTLKGEGGGGHGEGRKWGRKGQSFFFLRPRSPLREKGGERITASSF